MENEWKNQPVPVILGADLNAYSMARCFFDEFGVISHVFAREKLGLVNNLKYVNLHIVKGLDDCDVAVPELLKFARSVAPARPILIPCADWYMEMLQYARDTLDGHFYFHIPSFEIWRCVSDKASLYGIFSKYGIRYPKTEVISSPSEAASAYKALSDSIVIKPADSARYWKFPFSGMRKVYFAHSAEEASGICDTVFSSGYDGKVILQNRIFGSGGEGGRCSPKNSVLTTYSDSQGRVIRACLGDVLLEERGKTSYGNYLSIISKPLDLLSMEIIDMLNSIGYTGIANFDIVSGVGGKYCLELNPRQGRSFDYLRGSGINLPRLLFADMNGMNVTGGFAYRDCLWCAISLGTALKYATDKELVPRAKELICQGKTCLALANDRGNSVKRRGYIIAHNIRQNLKLRGSKEEKKVAVR